MGWCHLGAAKLLTLKFMGAMGLRGPTIQEAETADAEVCRQLALLMTNGFSLDQAIHELVEVRNGLYAWLQPRPKVVLNPGKFQDKLRVRPSPYDKKGKANGKGKGKKIGSCHAFQLNKCSFGDKCKFLHECEQCGSSEHGKVDCPELASRHYGQLLAREGEVAHAHVAPSSSTGCSDVRTDLVSLDTALDVRTKDVPNVSVSKEQQQSSHC